MKLYKIIIIIIAVLMVIAGAVITAVAVNMFDFNSGNPFDLLAPKEVSYNVEGDFSDIKISDISADVVLAVSDNGQCKVVCHETKKITHEVIVSDGCLNVTAKETGKWYNFISFGWYETKTTVYLPKSVYEKLSVTSTSGDITIPDGLEFDSVNITSTSGDVRFFGNADELNLASTSGDINVSDVSCTAFNAECTSGDIELVRLVAQGHLSAQSVSGDIELDNSDAQTLYLKTTSGDVEGTLLTSKVFIADSTSGDISVPQTTNTTTGGICEIKTTSGDIKMKLKAD